MGAAAQDAYGRQATFGTMALCHTKTCGGAVRGIVRGIATGRGLNTPGPAGLGDTSRKCGVTGDADVWARDTAVRRGVAGGEISLGEMLCIELGTVNELVVNELVIAI